MRSRHGMIKISDNKVLSRKKGVKNFPAEKTALFSFPNQIFACGFQLFVVLEYWLDFDGHSQMLHIKNAKETLKFTLE